MLHIDLDGEVRVMRSLQALRGLAALLIPTETTQNGDTVLARRGDVGALLELVENELRTATGISE